MQTRTRKDDEELVIMAIEGNQPAFSNLMNRHKELLKSYIVNKYPIVDAAEDLLLITFDKAFRNLQLFKPQFAFSTWLYTIADNTCVDYLRKKKSSDNSSHNLFHILDIHDGILIHSDPETEMISSQEMALLLQSINKLKPIYREPTRLRFLHGYAYEEIAKKLSLPQGTVKTRIHRAKKILSLWIKQY